MTCERNECPEAATWQMLEPPYLLVCPAHTRDLGPCVALRPDRGGAA